MLFRSSSDVSDLQINIPTQETQERFAHFLEAQDSEIVALKRQKELLESEKHALMQKFYAFNPARGEQTK